MTETTEKNGHGEATLTRDALIAELVKQQEAQRRACLEEIQGVLARHDCHIEAYITIQGNTVHTGYTIVNGAT